LRPTWQTPLAWGEIEDNRRKFEAGILIPFFQHSKSRIQNMRTLGKVTRYVFARLLAIALTIFIGVFITITILNQNGVVDEVVRREVDWDIRYAVNTGLAPQTTPAEIEQIRIDLEDEMGMNLPFALRNLRWTVNAMNFHWGQIISRTKNELNPTLSFFRARFTQSGLQYDVRQIITEHLPNTLLLIGSSNLIVFFLGIPLALYLSRRSGSWVDRLMGISSPFASIPSWIHGIILVMIFYRILHLIPYGEMRSIMQAELGWKFLLDLGRHMLLPMLAILLNLFLQCIYTWRTFFLIYSNEDYVTLAVALGVPPRRLERRFILQPTLPYIITSFALTLINVWQLTIALEYFFVWPGIGLLYVEAIRLNEVVVVIGIVVIFAYLLGAMVFVLDILYVIIDPRIRIGENDTVLHEVGAKKRWKPQFLSKQPTSSAIENRQKHQALPGFHLPKLDLKASIYRAWLSLKSLQEIFTDLLRQPSGGIGLVIVGFLVFVSIYTLISMPLEQTSQMWAEKMGYKGDLVTPKFAKPAWINSFLIHDLPETIDLDSRKGQAVKVAAVMPVSSKASVMVKPGKKYYFPLFLQNAAVSTSVGNGEATLSQKEENVTHMQMITITYTIPYSYQGFPQDMYLIMDASYVEKPPFVTITWIFPDGREVPLKSHSAIPGEMVNFSENITSKYLASHGLRKNLYQKKGDPGLYPAFYALLTSPQATTPENIRGTYALRLNAITFEEGSDVDARLVMVGQVYGLMGTDHMRRDLRIPLLWGAPVGLLVGILGALCTTLLAMIIAAACVWVGGWADYLIQRIVEVSMILPFLAIGVVFHVFLGANLWVVLAIVILLNALGSPVKAYRAAFLQVRQAPYIEAAQTYGAGGWRIIMRYMLPRLWRMLIPQLIILIPSFIFLEATLAMFGVSAGLPTWGNLIHDALEVGAVYGNYFWVGWPVGMLVLTGVGFALLGSALEHVLDKRTY
jgi:peptide/nickel transport system permease protein